jgi:hypothetical protein
MTINEKRTNAILFADCPGRRRAVLIAPALPLGFVFLAAVLTQYIQEDAFIYFRTASNLALYGEYSFNIGENYPAATSTLYAFLLAAHKVLFGDFFALTAQVMNIFAAALGTWLLACTLPRSTDEGGACIPFVFWVVAVSPPLVTLATSGMETALLFLSLATLVNGFHTRAAPLIVVAALLLPLMRVEATIAAVLVAILAAFQRDWRIVMWTVVGIGTGVLAVLVTNILLTGEAIPQTITAKNAAYQPLRSIEALLGRAWQIFFESSFFLGINSKFVPLPVYYLVGASALAVCTLVTVRYISALLTGRKEMTNEYATAVLSVGIIVTFPLGYVYGGVIFSWYLWPSSVFAYYLFARILATALAARIFVLWGIAALVTLLSLMNLVLLINYGYQEAQYRAAVGRFIASVAEPGDTLFLEPAGYIPYYAGLKTWDTVGLVSPEILDYRGRGDSAWWIDFVRDKRPTWIVERSPMASVRRGSWSVALFTERDVRTPRL